MNIFGLLKGAGNVAGRLLEMPGNLYKSKALFGLSGMTRGVGGMFLRAAPLLAIGATLGGIKAFNSLVGGPYDMNSPRTAWGYTPGRSAPGNAPMQFSTIQQGYIDQYASGNLMFALHNLRKG